MFGFMIGFLLGALVMFLLRGPSPHKGSHRMAPRKEIDGIWTVRDDRGKRPVDPSRPRVRRALILEDLAEVDSTRGDEELVGKSVLSCCFPAVPRDMLVTSTQYHTHQNHQHRKGFVMTTSTKTSKTSPAKAKAEAAPVEENETEGNETKVGPLHEAHAAYIKRVRGVDVDPEAIFLVYSTRVAFRKTSEEYQGVAQAKAALKEEQQKAKEELKAKRAEEREAKAKAKEEAKAAKAKEREEAKAKAAAEKEAKAAEKAKADAAAPKKGKGKQTAADALKEADGDTATSKPKKGKAAF